MKNFTVNGREVTAATSAPSEQDAKFSALPQGTPVIEPRTFEKAKVSNAAGIAEPVAVDSRGMVATRIRTEQRPTELSLLQVRVPTSAAVRKGDRLLAVFEMRAVEPLPKDGRGETEFVFELADEPHTQIATHRAEFGADWQRFYVPFEAKLDHHLGKAAVVFRVGHGPQTIEIAGVQVLNFGPDFPWEKLPSTSVSDARRKPAAP